MEHLNKAWLGLIAAGIFFLITFAVWNVVESVTGSNEGFFSSVQQFPTNQLLTQLMEEHLTNEAANFVGEVDSSTGDDFLQNQ